MFKKIIGYFKTLFGMKAEAMMDPAVQMEQALQEAREQDRELREQASRVIAHRTEIQMKLDRGVDAAAKAKTGATQALLNLKKAQESGDAAGVEKWQKAAQALALDLETQERLVEGLKTQYETADEQAELAKKQVSSNAMRLKQLTVKRMELIGKLEQAKMQEQVNKTLESINRPIESSGPSFSEIEDKINRRMANASAKAELEKDSLEGAQREIEESTNDLAGQARLGALMEELGMSDPAAAPPAEISSSSEPAPADNAAQELQELAEQHDTEIVKIDKGSES